jgi:4,5-dihydroxyphthalate decarboxylase
MPATVALHVALGVYRMTAALKDGRVSVPGVDLHFADFPNILQPIRQMCRDLAFDICEMPLVSYLLAREQGQPFTAMPVFVLRRFPQRSMFTSLAAAVNDPRDLVGKRAGARAYTDTTGVWSRGILKMMHGVDISTVRWLVSDEEHVAGYQLPANVRREPEADLLGMLSRGGLQLTVNIPSSSSPRELPPGIRPLLPDRAGAERAGYERTAIFPPSHTVVVRDSVLDAHPWLARELHQAFERARDLGLRDLAAEGPCAGWEQELLDNRDLVGEQPLAHGLAANHRALAMLIKFAREQGILSSAPRPEDVFASID